MAVTTIDEVVNRSRACPVAELAALLGLAPEEEVVEAYLDRGISGGEPARLVVQTRAPVPAG